MRKNSTNINKSSTKLNIIGITLIITLIQFISLTYALSITEIMFNPQGSDTGREWIELTLNETDGCINISEYTLFEENTNHKLYVYNKEDTCDYALIYSDINKLLQDYNYLNDTYFPLYKSSFSLSNTGEILRLKHDNDTVYEINYTTLINETKITEGHSLEYKNNIWRNSELVGGDPLNLIEDAIKIADNTSNTSTNIINTTSDNNINSTDTINITAINRTNNITNYYIMDNNTLINNTYNINESENIIINNTNTIEIINNTPVINNNTPLENNITNNNTIEYNNIENITNNTTISLNQSNNTCRAYISILLKNDSIIQENDIPIKFYNILTIEYNHTGNSTRNTNELNYSIEYWVEDLFGNIVKNKLLTINQNEKTFTPNIFEEDRILKIKNNIKYINCESIINYSEKTILIKNSLYTKTLNVCPKCITSSVNCEDKVIAKPIIIKDNYTSCVKENSTKPVIKIINICNKTDSNENIISITSNPQLANNLNNNNNFNNIITVSNNTSTNKNNNKFTNNIIYESQNLQNKLYAIIGLIIVTIISLILLIRRYFLIIKGKKEAI